MIVRCYFVAIVVKLVHVVSFEEIESRQKNKQHQQKRKKTLQCKSSFSIYERNENENKTRNSNQKTTLPYAVSGALV